MKIKNIPLIFSLATLAASQSAFALTTAEDTISNTATISYNVGGTTQSNIGSSPTGNSSGAGTSTDFTVDRVIDLTVTEGATVNVVPNSATVTPKDITFTLSNDGNSEEIFNITLLPSITNDETGANADDFDTSGCSITSVSGTASFATLAVTVPQESSTVITVNCDIPVTGATVSNGKQSHIELRANANRAEDNGSADVAGGIAQTVYGDAAAAGTTDAGAKQGDHAAINTYLIQTTELEVTKTSEVVCDPYNVAANPKRIPGAIIKYTIAVENLAAAGAQADGVVINDPIPATMTYVSVDGDVDTACSGIVSPSVTTDNGGTNLVTLTGSDTGAATVISKTMAMPVDSKAKLVFFAKVN